MRVASGWSILRVVVRLTPSRDEHDARLVLSDSELPSRPPFIVGTITEDACVGHLATRQHWRCRISRAKARAGRSEHQRGASLSPKNTHLDSQRVGAPLPGWGDLEGGTHTGSPSSVRAVFVVGVVFVVAVSVVVVVVAVAVVSARHGTKNSDHVPLFGQSGPVRRSGPRTRRLGKP